MKWERGIGWSSKLQLSNHISANVNKGYMKDSLFSFNVFGVNSKQIYNTAEQAQAAAIAFAKHELKIALEAITGEGK